MSSIGQINERLIIPGLSLRRAKFPATKVIGAITHDS